MLRDRLLYVLIVIIALMTSPAIRAADIAASHFDADSEGWTVIGNGVQILPQWSASGGNPGGNISLMDLNGNSMDAQWVAPSAFHGDLSEAYGGILSFEMTQQACPSGTHLPDVYLIGGPALTPIELRLETSGNPLTAWTGYSAPLDETGGWRVGTLGGLPPTYEQFMTALSNVQEIKIRAEYCNDSGHIYALDNVVIRPACPPGDLNADSQIDLDDFAILVGHLGETVGAALAGSGFDLDREGWAVINGGNGNTWLPVWVPTQGNPGGFIRVTDPQDSDTMYWLAGPSFLGDQSAAYGGALEFDSQQSATSSQYHGVDVRLQGGGLELVFETSGNPYQTPAWAHYRVSLIESAGWRVGALGGAIPTPGQFQALLANLTSLQIRAEYRSGADTDGLDNPTITPANPPGDLDGDGHVDLHDFQIFQTSFGQSCP